MPKGAMQLGSLLMAQMAEPPAVADLMTVGAATGALVAAAGALVAAAGALVGAADSADRLADELAATVGIARTRAAQLRMRPRVYFEEWDDPMISGIGWVSELIEAAGGVDVFADRASCKSATERIVTAEEVIRNEPDIIIGSWCGKKFRPEKLAKRPGFDRIPAVKYGALHEIKSPLILQPGPAALTDGLAALQAIVANTISRKTVAAVK